MTVLINRRVAGEIEGDFVLFLIGVRINRIWKAGKWLPVFRAMPRMLAELARDPSLGLLHARTHFGFPTAMLVQYWRSFEHLQAYASERTQHHLPAQKAFNQAIGTSGDVGIWHETYLIAAGKSESIYVNMPLYGMAKAGHVVDATGIRATAGRRLAAGAGSPADPVSVP